MHQQVDIPEVMSYNKYQQLEIGFDQYRAGQKLDYIRYRSS